MGRTRATATMQVYQFEKDWKQFARAPRAVNREAFGDLVALAHFHAAALAHAASPFTFEMIVLAMLVGLVQRAETLEAYGVMQWYDSPQTGITLSFQTNMQLLMLQVRRRLATQKHELYTFARALRHQDQKALRALLSATRTEGALLVPISEAALSDEMLVASLVRIMRRLIQLEKQYPGQTEVVSADDWSSACLVK